MDREPRWLPDGEYDFAEVTRVAAISAASRPGGSVESHIEEALRVLSRLRGAGHQLKGSERSGEWVQDTVQVVRLERGKLTVPLPMKVGQRQA